jgi:hypothetical protein
LGCGDRSQVDAAVPLEGSAISAATARAKQDSLADVIVHAEDGTVEEEKTV